MLAADATTEDWRELIQAEYLEIPDLHLTKREVQRLWGLDPAQCDSVLDALVDTGFLRRTLADAYVRADAGC